MGDAKASQEFFLQLTRNEKFLLPSTGEASQSTGCLGTGHCAQLEVVAAAVSMENQRVYAKQNSHLPFHCLFLRLFS